MQGFPVDGFYRLQDFFGFGFYRNLGLYFWR